MMDQQTPWQKHRKKLIFLAIIIVVVYVGLYILRHGFLNLEISGHKGGEYSITLLDQKTNTKKVFKSSSPTFRKLVRRSSYEVTVTGNNAGVWAQVNTKGSLGTTEKKVTLQAERARTYVGEQPKSCMTYGAMLISLECGEYSQTLTIHQPGTSDRPPFITNPANELHGIVVGVANTPAGVIGLVQTDSHDEEAPGYIYSLTTITPDAQNITETTPIQVSNPEDEYRILTYKTGVLVYNLGFTELQYYPTISSPPITIPSADPDDGYEAKSIQISGETISLVYSNLPDTEDVSLAESPAGTKSILYMTTGQDLSRYELEGHWPTMTMCAPMIVCASSGVGEKQQVTVYSIQGKELEPSFTVNNVSQIFYSQSGVLLVNDTQIMRLNPATQTASIDYTLGSNAFCGLGHSSNPTQYVVCISDEYGSHALLIDSDQEVRVAIDKIAAKLQQDSHIDQVSVDRNRVYITPDYGEVEFNEEESAFEFNSAKQAAANAAVQSLVQQTQLTANGYQVVNLLSDSF